MLRLRVEQQQKPHPELAQMFETAKKNLENALADSEVGDYCTALQYNWGTKSVVPGFNKELIAMNNY